MIRFKKIFRDGTHVFVDMKGGIVSAIQIARYHLKIDGSLHQVDIYDGPKLIASIYG